MSERLRARRQSKTPTANGRGLTGLGTTCTVSHPVALVKGVLVCALTSECPDFRARPEISVEPLLQAGDGAEVRSDVAAEHSLQGGAGDSSVTGDTAPRRMSTLCVGGDESLCEELCVARRRGGVGGEGAVGPAAGDQVGLRGVVSSSARHGSRVSGGSVQVGTCYGADGIFRSHPVSSTGDTPWPGPSSSGASS